MPIAWLVVYVQFDKGKTFTCHTLSLDMGSLSAGHCGDGDLKE